MGTEKDMELLRVIASIIDDANISVEPAKGTPEMKEWVRRYNVAYETIEKMTCGGGREGGFDTAQLAANVNTAAGQGLLSLREMLTAVL